MDIVRLYHSCVEWTMDVTGLGDTALHFNVGLLILFGVRLASRRRLNTMVPLAPVIVAELANELLDRMYWGAWRWDDTAADIFHTLFWPVLISWGAWARCIWPNLLTSDGSRGEPVTEQDGEEGAA